MLLWKIVLKKNILQSTFICYYSMTQNHDRNKLIFNHQIQKGNNNRPVIINNYSLPHFMFFQMRKYDYTKWNSYGRGGRKKLIPFKMSSNECDERGVRKVLIKSKVHIDRLLEHRKSPVHFQLVELIRV